MKVIVLGNKGLVGSTVYNILKQKHEVIGRDLDLLDLNDLNAVQIFFKENKADILVNLFGKNDHVQDSTIGKNNVLTIEESEIRQYFEINTVLLFRVCREFCVNNPSGKVYNFSSLYGHHVPNPKYYPDNEHKSLGYVLSKAAVVMLNKYLAVHFPSFSFVDIVMGGVENNQSDSFKKEFLNDLVIKRMLNAEEVAFLLEGLFTTEYITGTSIFIDGGKNLF
jgi:NAD(P)-dependent dehydrogenase (short-subunit alcohol dehydrogenase family)